MKNKDFQTAKLRKQLEKFKEDGKKELIWELSYSQKRIIKELGYKIEPYLYYITTRTFFRIGNIESNLIKEIHFKSKQNKHIYKRQLNNKQKKVLDKYGVRYRVAKYKIHLV